MCFFGELVYVWCVLANGGSVLEGTKNISVDD